MHRMQTTWKTPLPLAMLICILFLQRSSGKVASFENPPAETLRMEERGQRLQTGGSSDDCAGKQSKLLG
eukprot:767660-Hanusia_phi.AAC.7